MECIKTSSRRVHCRASFTNMMSPRVPPSPLKGKHHSCSQLIKALLLLCYPGTSTYMTLLFSNARKTPVSEAYGRQGGRPITERRPGLPRAHPPRPVALIPRPATETLNYFIGKANETRVIDDTVVRYSVPTAKYIGRGLTVNTMPHLGLPGGLNYLSICITVRT